MLTWSTRYAPPSCCCCRFYSSFIRSCCSAVLLHKVHHSCCCRPLWFCHGVMLRCGRVWKGPCWGAIHLPWQMFTHAHTDAVAASITEGSSLSMFSCQPNRHGRIIPRRHSLVFHAFIHAVQFCCTRALPGGAQPRAVEGARKCTCVMCWYHATGNTLSSARRLLSLESVYPRSIICFSGTLFVPLGGVECRCHTCLTTCMTESSRESN